MKHGAGARYAPIAALLALAAAPLVAGEPLLVEDFDGETTLMDEILADETIRSSIGSQFSFSGERALEMADHERGRFSKRHALGDGYDELYARYMFRIGEADSSCWSWQERYKLMGFEGGSRECKGGKYRSDGTDCFSVRTRFNYPYLGVRVESAPYPGHFNFVNTKVKVNDGAWHCLEFRVKLNEPGEKDGQIDVWVDGRKKSRKKLEFRTVPELQIDKWWFTYWANDSWCGPLYIDDLIVAREPIGCPDNP